MYCVLIAFLASSSKHDATGTHDKKMQLESCRRPCSREPGYKARASLACEKFTNQLADVSLKVELATLKFASLGSAANANQEVCMMYSTCYACIPLMLAYLSTLYELLIMNLNMHKVREW